jgi:hypothetical protein
MRAGGEMLSMTVDAEPPHPAASRPPSPARGEGKKEKARLVNALPSRERAADGVAGRQVRGALYLQPKNQLFLSDLMRLP